MRQITTGQVVEGRADLVLGGDAQVRKSRILCRLGEFRVLTLPLGLILLAGTTPEETILL